MTEEERLKQQQQVNFGQSAGADIAEEQIKQDPYLLSQDPYGPVYNILKKQQQEPDYYEQQKRLEKMQRTNALSDTFRLLADTVGLNKGASVQKRQPNVQLDQATERLRQSIQQGQKYRDKVSIDVAMQKAKQKQAELNAEAEMKSALKDYEERKKIATQYELPLLEERLQNTLKGIDERKNSALEVAGFRSQKQKELAEFNQSQANQRQSKSLEQRDRQRAESSAKERGLYEITDESGSPVARLDAGGVDRMVSEIIKDPALAREYDIIVNKFGDGLQKETERRLFVQKHWSKTPALKNLAINLNRSSGVQRQSQQGAGSPERILSISNKLTSVIDIVDNEYENIKTQTIVNGVPDYTARFNKLYKLLLATKKLTPEEANEFASDMVYNE